MMIRLYENRKVKRVLAWLILFSTVLTSFITSTTETVYADSNSRRRTSINLAAGVGFGSISNFEDIDEVSLQTIAIYLSNFYLPFVTVLDGDYTKEGAEDSGNSQHVEAMKNALIRNCGFKKDVAEYLVGYVLNQSLASCKTVYVKTSELRDCFDKCVNSADPSLQTSSFLGLSNGEQFKGYTPSSDYWNNSTICYTGLNNITAKDSNRERWTYIEEAGKVAVDGVEYTPVSYSIFLGIMAQVWREVYVPEHGSTEYTVKSLPPMQFYCLRTSNGKLKAMPVFSNNRRCLLALLNAFQYCDVENGYSTGFMSISGTDVESINNPEVTQYSLATCPNVYVNWEGSLVYNNGVYRTIILPGCMNPYMMQAPSEEDSASGAWTFAFNHINNTSISSISLGLVDESRPISLRNTAYYRYRVMIGSNSSNFDQSAWGTWGENQQIFELLNSISYLAAVSKTGDDYATFPILSARIPEAMCWACDANNTFAYVMDDWCKFPSCKDLVWYNQFQAVTADTPLDTYFPVVNVLDNSFISTLQEFNIDTYAQFKNVKNQGHSLEYPKSTQKLFQNIYLTYCFAAFNSETTRYTSKGENIVRMSLNFDNFPESNIDIDWSSIQQDQLGLEVMSFVYYLLHPTEGVAYVARLFKNKMSGILLAWHEDIVGATSSNAATGMTKYLGTSSYTTTPNLKDISWVAGLLNIYNNIIVYLIILMCLILLCYILTGSMTIQRGIVGVVLFGLCAFLPPIAINTAVDTVNTTSDAIFSKKFDFWAICQMQNFVDNYVEAMNANSNGDFASYAAFVISTQSADIGALDSDEESSVTYSGTKLKWMAPKKYNSLSSLVQAVNEGTAMGNSSASFLRNTVLNIVVKSTSGETYLSDTDALYLYRDYSDIFKYAHASYNILSTFNYKGDLGKQSETAWTKDEAPLAIYIEDPDNIEDSDNSSYNKAWTGIKGAGKSDVYRFVDSAVSTTLTDTAKSETSSVAHISKGYLYNTLNYYPSEAHKNYYYLYEYSGDPTNISRNTLAVSYLANYTNTYRQVHDNYSRLKEVVDGTRLVTVGDPASVGHYNFGLPKATKDSSSINGSYQFGYQEIIGLGEADLPKDATKTLKIYKDLSDVFYGLYSESPFYYFNANIRDQLNSSDVEYSYDFNTLNKGKKPGTNGEINSLAKLFLMNNQEYFFNFVERAGDGYGELRDFTNMHDFFYFVVPYLREGVELARLYDDVFGLYVDDDCSLIVNADGSCLYDGHSFKDLAELREILDGGAYTEEEKYKLWHTYNTYTILSAYTPWLDTMLDCDYSKPETITVMGERFRVSDPLNPNTYYREDEHGKLVEGRYMVFSKSEMNAMGLTTADLTTVERKIIQFQDNVYSNALNLMNYYTFSDEVMIHAFAMLQTFEFNKLFSQTSLVSEDYTMYPQGYELKAFSYDAYLRMIVSGASGESLMFNGKGSAGNVSIYERVMKNTSLFFGIFLLLNDILAVYLVPGLKIFFLVTIFLCSIMILIGAVIKMEMNILQVLWKSLFAPLLSFSAICIGLSLIVSMFMKTGANGVATSEFFISMGDPTSAIIVQVILNSGVVILLFKICKKCFKDLITYGKAAFDNMGSAVVGAVGAVGAGFAAGNLMSRISGEAGNGSGISRTAKQRGKDNDPRSGKSGVGSALASGAAGGALGAGLAAGGNPAADSNYDALDSEAKRRANAAQDRVDATRGMNKYDKKAFEGANAKHDAAKDKAKRSEELAANATGLRKKRFEIAQKWNQRKADSAEIKADNVKKYGNGLKGKAMGLTTVFGKGRKTRLDGIHADAMENQKKREGHVTDARAKRNAEVAKANASAMKEAGIGQSNSLSLTQININVGKRAGGKQKKGGTTSSGKQPRNKNKLPPASAKKKSRKSAKK